MRRTPSVVPDTPCEAYLVLDDFGGNIGKAWRETIEANTTRDALVRGTHTTKTARLEHARGHGRFYDGGALGEDQAAC